MCIIEKNGIKIKLLSIIFMLSKWPKEANLKQKVLVEAYGEQEAHVEAYNKQKTFEDVQNKEITSKEARVPKNYEISINYVHNREKLDQNKVVINNIYAFQVALDIIRNEEDPEPQSVEEC